MAGDTARVNYAGGQVGTLETRNRGGRTGSYYLPSGYHGRVLPVAVLLHGSEDDGRSGMQL